MGGLEDFWVKIGGNGLDHLFEFEDKCSAVMHGVPSNFCLACRIP